MAETNILFWILLSFFDYVNISMLRDFLKDFLVGNRNAKSALKIHKQQSVNNRITLNYIREYLKTDIRAFKMHHIVYLVYLAAIIPRYIIILFANLFFKEYSLYIMLAFFCVDTVFFVVYRLQLNSFLSSKYRNGK